MPRERYLQADYMGPERVHSYAHQLGTVLRHRPTRALEVGVGSGYVKQSLRMFGIDLDTLDLNAGNEPDIVGSVDDIPLPDDAYDMVSCCQVLEHLPYERSKVAMRELARVARSRVLVSLPDVSRHASLSIRAPKLGRHDVLLGLNAKPRPVPPSRTAEMGHQWEIGFAGYSTRRVIADLEAAGLVVEKHWRVPELPWHHFFDCRVARQSGS